MKKTILFALLILSFLIISPTNAYTGTCPDSNGWVKIDSGDLSLYPVDDATEYCFKAGNWPTISYIPSGGFGQSGSCTHNIKYCDLSHWSYKKGKTKTPTATNTNTSTITSTATPTNTLTET